MGADIAQGYYLSKALPADQFNRWLAAYQDMFGRPPEQGIGDERRSWRAVMGCLDIDQAARASGLTARDVRLLIERGKLPATRPAGRWLIDQRHLAAATPRPEVDGVRPIGADSTEDQGHAPGPAGGGPGPGRGPAGRARRAAAAAARAGVLAPAQPRGLDGGAGRDARQAGRAGVAPASCRPRARAAARVRPPEPASGLRARDALTPLFRATTDSRDVGAPAERD